VVVIGRTGRSFLPPTLTPDRSETSRAAFFGIYDPARHPPRASRARPDENRVISVARDPRRAINDPISFSRDDWSHS